jgi:predicted anti-sigma-YlaC factor YlaD
MKCKDYSDLIQKAMDGEINDIENARLMQHIKTCKKCKEEYSIMNDIDSFLDEALQIEPPKDFDSLVMDKITHYENSRLKRRYGVQMLCYNFTFIVLVALVSIVLYRSSGPGYELTLKISTYLGIVSDIITGAFLKLKSAMGGSLSVLTIILKVGLVFTGILAVMFTNVRGEKVWSIIKRYAGKSILVLCLLVLAGISMIMVVATLVIVPALYLVSIAALSFIMLLMAGEFALFKVIKKNRVI